MLSNKKQTKKHNNNSTAVHSTFTHAHFVIFVNVQLDNLWIISKLNFLSVWNVNSFCILQSTMNFMITKRKDIILYAEPKSCIRILTRFLFHPVNGTACSRNPVLSWFLLILSKVRRCRSKGKGQIVLGSLKYVSVTCKGNHKISK
jgi:hypothetical protein